MKQFNTEEQIKKYIKESISSIELLNECRLYREEQLQITESVTKARNSIEWLIRINGVIKNFIYAISKSYEYAKLMNSPFETTENSQLYAFYLEDAVYRDILLWDLFRQFLNEFFECGYNIDDEVNIFSFLNNSVVKKKVGNSNIKKIKDYLICTEHQNVRGRLRNKFTHSLDDTSSYIFHRVKDGMLQADLNNAFPKHPYINIVFVLDDIHKCLEFVNKYIEKLEDILIKNIMIVTVEWNLKCGKSKLDTQLWSITVLKEKAERILSPCENPCDYAIEYQGCKVCKPISVSYCRINETDKKYRGKIDLHMNYEEMNKNFKEMDTEQNNSGDER